MKSALWSLCLLLLVACGKETKTKWTPPADTGSAVERAKINQALDQIQEDLRAEGHVRDLHQVKVVVSDFPGEANIQGRCYRNKKGRGLAIVISHEVLQYEAPDEDSMPWYFTVLLHEVGHCYFNREHEDVWYPFANHELVFLDTADKDAEHRMGWITPSVMNTQSHPSMLKVLRRYYVKEIAGLDRARDWQDFKRYTDVQMEEVHPIFSGPKSL